MPLDDALVHSDIGAGNGNRATPSGVAVDSPPADAAADTAAAVVMVVVVVAMFSAVPLLLDIVAATVYSGCRSHIERMQCSMHATITIFFHHGLLLIKYIRWLKVAVGASSSNGNRWMNARVWKEHASCQSFIDTAFHFYNIRNISPPSLLSILTSS